MLVNALTLLGKLGQAWTELHVGSLLLFVMMVENCMHQSSLLLQLGTNIILFFFFFTQGDFKRYIFMKKMNMLLLDTQIWSENKAEVVGAF